MTTIAHPEQSSGELKKKKTNEGHDLRYLCNVYRCVCCLFVFFFIVFFFPDFLYKKHKM